MFLLSFSTSEGVLTAKDLREPGGYFLHHALGFFNLLYKVNTAPFTALIREAFIVVLASSILGFLNSKLFRNVAVLCVIALQYAGSEWKAGVVF